MRAKEFAVDIWTSRAERDVLSRMRQPAPLNSYEENDQFIIEQLIRKNLVTKIQGKDCVYVYPND